MSKFQVLFCKKRQTQDSFNRTLVVPVLPLDFRFRLSFPFAKSHVFIIIKVLIFCVEFRELSHLTRDLSILLPFVVLNSEMVVKKLLVLDTK